MRISQLCKIIVCSIFSIFLMGSVGGAAFAQGNTARWGGDYDYISTNNGRQCDRACEDDRRCKAWVFIKRTKQCRLKYFVPDRISSNCCVSGVKGDRRVGAGGGDGRGGKRQRCGEYAERAIDQGNKNLRQRCDFRGPKWHTNYNRHYNYCMDNRGRDWRATEQDRKIKLDRCEQRIAAKQTARCDHLGRIAVEQNKANIKNGCGFKAPYWNSSLARHVKMCRDEGGDRARDTRYSRAKFEKREARLNRCMLRGGGARDKACDDFSKTAIDRYKQSLRYRCKYSDSVWNDNYDLQYNWCRKVDAGARAKRLDVMRYQIKRCKKRRGWRKIFKF